MTDIDHIMRVVEASISSPEFKARLLSMLARNGLYRAPRSSLLHYRAQVAVKLMESGSRPEVRDSLQQRFGVSRRSAYRLICRALDVRQGKLFD